MLHYRHNVKYEVIKSSPGGSVGYLHPVLTCLVCITYKEASMAIYCELFYGSLPKCTLIDKIMPVDLIL